jgi:predicted component of type VI protein secretion system
VSELTLVPAEGEAFPLTRDRVVVGRDASADLVVRDKSVSRRHATLERQGEGYVVVDEKSANGTWIDGQRVTKAALAAGQRIRFGAVAFEVRAAPPKRQKAHQPPQAKASAPPPPPVSSDETSPIMSVAQAAELLGVLPGTPAHEVKRRYHKIYNDYQVRLTNAPTPSLKRLYQRNLQEVQAAAELLSPGVVREG